MEDIKLRYYEEEFLATASEREREIWNQLSQYQKEAFIKYIDTGGIDYKELMVRTREQGMVDFFGDIITALLIETCLRRGYNPKTARWKLRYLRERRMVKGSVSYEFSSRFGIASAVEKFKMAAIRTEFDYYERFLKRVRTEHSIYDTTRKEDVLVFNLDRERIWWYVRVVS